MKLKDILIRPKPQEVPLMDEIRLTVAQMNSLRTWFDSESDDDLIESCVYQMEALEARYRYLLRLARECGMSRDAFTGLVENNIPRQEPATV